MRLPLFPTLLAAFSFALPATAQDVQVFGGDEMRATTTRLFFGEGIMGGISIEYGQPEWKAEYDGMRDQLKGRLLRLGMNWWTVMTTSFALEIGGTQVPAGCYLLGLHCDKDGKFALAFLEATKGLQGGAVPFPLDEKGNMNWKPDFLAPLEFKENAVKEGVAKLQMTLDFAARDIADGRYVLSWGRHELVAKVAVRPAQPEKKAPGK